MTTPLPRIRAKYGEGIGVEVFCSFPELYDDQLTYLDADAAGGASSISADGTNFAIGQYIVIGQPGNIKTEIVQIHASTAPTTTTITLATALQFAHNRGDIIRFIPYNDISLEVSSNGGVSYSANSPVAIRADSSETYIQQANDLSTYLYRFRFFNSSTSLYSTYSDIANANGYADNTIWSVENRALSELGEEQGELLNKKFLDDSLQEGRRMADQNPAVYKWSFRTMFGVVFSQMLSGQWRIPAPANLRDPNTPKNILSIRIGDQNRPVTYQDRVRFNQNYLNVVHATVTVQAVANQTTLVLSSTHDLPVSGAITIANNTVGDGLISINYTGNSKTTNTLSGVTGINRTVLVGTDTWLRGIFGLPTAYTIDAGYIYFDVPLKIDYDGMDVKGDYYSIIPPISTDDQAFDEPFFDLYVPWLKYKIKYKKANGKIDRDGDTDYKDWLSGLSNLIGQETPSQRIRFVPDIEGFLSATE